MALAVARAVHVAAEADGDSLHGTGGATVGDQCRLGVAGGRERIAEDELGCERAVRRGTRRSQCCCRMKRPQGPLVVAEREQRAPPQCARADALVGQGQ